MEHNQGIIGAIAILVVLLHLRGHNNSWQLLLGSLRIGPNFVRSDQQTKNERLRWESTTIQQQSRTSRRLNTTDDSRTENVFANRTRPQPRIIGGTAAAAGAFPFYAKSVTRGEGDLLCGATLIWENVLLSAAHCQGAFKNGVAIGGTKFNDTHATTLQVEIELRHPDYNPTTQENDIMLIKARNPSTATIVNLNSNASVPAVRDNVTTIGFGLTDPDGKNASDVLRQVNVNIYDDDACFSLYSNYVNEKMLCAGTVEGRRDSCQGDSGGPLLTLDKVQVGIVSNGFGCGEPDIPSIYTDVRAYLVDWIQPQVCEWARPENLPTFCTRELTTQPVQPSTPSNAPSQSPVNTPTQTPSKPTSPTVPSTPRPTPRQSKILPTTQPVPPDTPVPAPIITSAPGSTSVPAPLIPKQMMMMRQKAPKGMQMMMKTMQPKAVKQGMMMRPAKKTSNVFSVLKGN